MDALSEILKSIKLRHTAVGTLQLGAPWGLRSNDFDAPIVYGLADGPPCWLQLPGCKPVQLMPGDVVLITGRRYCMMSSPDTATVDMGTAWLANDLPPFDPRHEPGTPLHFMWGGGGLVTKLLGIAFGLSSPRRNPLVAALPPLIVLRSEHGDSLPWTHAAIAFFSAKDADSQGFAATARLLAELVFVSVVRSHLLHEPRRTRGWLRGLTDPCVARALRALHAQPGVDWTVASLAREAGLSRTTFATRFAELVDASPIEYLTHLRMYLAAERIVHSQPNLTELAFELGYSSDAAFREAFKRRYGVPPSRYTSADVPDHETVHAPAEPGVT